MLDKTLTKIAEMPLNMRFWTVDEYYRMAKAGILRSVKLIAGQVIKKMSLQSLYLMLPQLDAKRRRSLREK